MRSKILVPLTLLLLIAVGACTTFKPACLVKEKVAEGLTPVVSSALSCSKPDVVKARITTGLGAVGLCKTTAEPTGAVADVVCPAVVGSVVHKVVTFGVEAAFPGAGCTGAVQEASLTLALTEACKQLPVEYAP